MLSSILAQSPLKDILSRPRLLQPRPRNCSHADQVRLPFSAPASSSHLHTPQSPHPDGQRDRTGHRSQLSRKASLPSSHSQFSIQQALPHASQSLTPSASSPTIGIEDQRTRRRKRRHPARAAASDLRWETDVRHPRSRLVGVLADQRGLIPKFGCTGRIRKLRKIMDWRAG